MDVMYYMVRYEGPFAFIKPWTSVRDGVTYSQQFLTPSVLEGIEKKLFPELLPVSGLQGKICRYKLRYAAVSVQQEQTQIRGWEYKSKEKRMVRPRSVLKRGVLLKPVLLLAFSTQEDAWRATMQHICLCRNEDVLFPLSTVEAIPEKDFQKLPGFELRFGLSEQSFLVGYNRFDGNKPMYGWLEIDGNAFMGGGSDGRV